MAALGDGADFRDEGTDTAASQSARTEQWVREFHADVYKYVLHLCGSSYDAEDLTQQTFLVAHANAHQLRDESRLRPWLLAIARSRFLKWLAKRRPANATDAVVELEDCGVEEPLPYGVHDGQGDSERLHWALAQLPPQWRLMLTMYYYDQATYKEIAAELGLPIGTVMSRLARAKDKLRRLYFGSANGPRQTPVVTETSADSR